METESGLQRLTLKSLNTKVTNSVIVGIIIRSQNVRIINSKEDNNEKGVWNFTIRDSITDYINITSWGSGGYINHLYQKFHVGDVVDIMRPKIRVRHIDDNGEQYRPSVTSPFTITLNEGQSSIIVHEGDNYVNYLPLLQYPTKPAYSYLSLGDIVNNGGTIRGDNVDLLVAVQNVGAIQKLKTKSDGREVVKRDIKILDQSHVGMRITFWEEEFIQRAAEWKERETILFLADIKVDWSDFQKGMVALPHSKTIITEDPSIPQAEILRKYASTIPLHFYSIIDQMTSSVTDPSTINNVMTTINVLKKGNFEQNVDNETETRNVHEKQFTALLYAFITDLDLDGYTTLVTTRCERCFEKINENVNMCVNLNCPVGSGAEKGSPKPQFDIRVGISDHLGSLKCKMVGQIAEKNLGCTAFEFMKMSDDEKAELKWRFLLERFKIRIVVKKSDFSYPIISILSWEKATYEEVASRLPFTNNINDNYLDN